MHDEAGRRTSGVSSNCGHTVVQRTWPIVWFQGWQQIHHARVDREALAPTGLAVPGAEVDSNPKRLSSSDAALEQPDHRLCHDESDIALEAVPESETLVSQRVTMWREIHPDVVATDFHRIHTHVIRP